jgi:hypothetical protein
MAAIVGLCLLAGGSYFYAQVASQWQQLQSWQVQIAGAASPNFQLQMDGIRAWYFGSIGAVVLGVLLSIAGIAQAVSASAAPPGKRHTHILERIGAAAVVLAFFGGCLGALRSSPIQPVFLRGAPAQALYAEPRTAHGGTPRPAREGIHGLAQLGSLEWKYLERYGTFAPDLGSLGIADSIGSAYTAGPHYIYVVRRATASEIVIEATGKIRTLASGIKLALFLTADGRSRAIRYR